VGGDRVRGQEKRWIEGCRGRNRKRDDRREAEDEAHYIIYPVWCFC